MKVVTALILLAGLGAVGESGFRSLEPLSLKFGAMGSLKMKVAPTLITLSLASFVLANNLHSWRGE